MDVNNKEIKEKWDLVTSEEIRNKVKDIGDFDTENGIGDEDDTKDATIHDLKEAKNICQSTRIITVQETNQNNKEVENLTRIRETNEPDADEDEVIEKISEKEAESRFLLWYNDIREREEWNKRRIKELETFVERYKQTIASLKENDRKLQQRYAEALIEIKVLRKKNLSTNNDHSFLESYKSLSLEKDELAKTAREQNHIIKSLKKDIYFMRARRSLEYAQRLRAWKMGWRTTTEHLMKQTRITELVETRAGPQRNLVKSKNYEKLVHTKKSVFETNNASVKAYSNQKIERNESKSREDVADENAKCEREKIKTTSSVSLPDIRAKPGHVMWKW